MTNEGQSEESVTALLGLILMTQPNQQVRVPLEMIERGLPANSGVRVWQDPATMELVVKIQNHGEEDEG